MKISSKIHGIIDYIFVVFLWLSPTLFGLGEKTALFTYVLGGVHLGLTVLTNFEVGIIKLIPFRVHGLIELVVALALGGVAFYLGNLEGELSRNYYLGLAVTILVVFLLTDFKRTTVVE